MHPRFIAYRNAGGFGFQPAKSVALGTVGAGSSDPRQAAAPPQNRVLSPRQPSSSVLTLARTRVDAVTSSCTSSQYDLPGNGHARMVRYALAAWYRARSGNDGGSNNLTDGAVLAMEQNGSAEADNDLPEVFAARMYARRSMAVQDDCLLNEVAWNCIVDWYASTSNTSWWLSPASLLADPLMPDDAYTACLSTASFGTPHTTPAPLDKLPIGALVTIPMRPAPTPIDLSRAPAPPREPPLDLPPVVDTTTPRAEDPSLCDWTCKIVFSRAKDKAAACNDFADCVTKYSHGAVAEQVRSACMAEGASAITSSGGPTACPQAAPPAASPPAAPPEPAATPWWKSPTYWLAAGGLLAAATIGYLALRRPRASLALAAAGAEGFSAEERPIHRPLEFQVPAMTAALTSARDSAFMGSGKRGGVVRVARSPASTGGWDVTSTRTSAQHFSDPVQALDKFLSLINQYEPVARTDAGRGPRTITDVVEETAASEVSRRARVGTRVAFDPSAASLALYSRPPRRGEQGTITTVPLGGRRASYLPGPGGGLLYVTWDQSGTMGVSPHDVTYTKHKPSRKQAPYEGAEAVVEEETVLLEHGKVHPLVWSSPLLTARGGRAKPRHGRPR